MISNSASKSARCIGRILASARAAAGLVVGADHLAHGEDAALLEEHVLGAAQADALGAEVARLAWHRAACRRWRARRARAPRRPSAMTLAKSPDSSGWRIFTRPLQHLALAAVDGDDVALAQGRAPPTVMRAGLGVDAQRAGAAHARPAHAARDHGGVAGHAAARGEDAGRRVHAVDVLGAGLDAHQDHLAALALQRLGLVGVEHDLARRGAGRGRQAARRARPSRRSGSIVGCSSWSSAPASMRSTASLCVDQALVDEVDGDLERGLARCACRSASAASRACRPGW